MPRTIIPVADWQERLATNFAHDGIIGGQMMPLMRKENDAGEIFSNTYAGFMRLSDSSQSFAVETLARCTREIIVEGSKINPHFQIIFVDFLMLLRRLRAASVLVMNGYPGPGLTILRDIADKSIHLSALFQRLVTYDDLMGFNNKQPPKGAKEELKNLRRTARVNTEKRLMGQFIGTKSGLNPSDVDLLKLWDDVFDLETHGSFISSTVALMPWVNGTSNLQLIDNNATLCVAFVNRFTDVAWMYHRLISNLQIEDGFGSEWGRRWEILDDSFWQSEAALINSSTKTKIGDAFIRFIDAKFPFNAATRLASKTPRRAFNLICVEIMRVL